MPSLHITALDGVPEVRPGDDLAALLMAAAPGLTAGDIVVISSKVVSKAEGRAVHGRSRNDVVAEETFEVVARRGELQIARTRHGLVLAAAGVDSSNVEPGVLLPLPIDPDASARAIRARLRELWGVEAAVVISDTAGRPWRAGQTDIAIGVAGMVPVVDLAGRTDRNGNTLHVTAPAVADEVAAAAELVKGKAAGTPFAVVRGLSQLLTEDDGPGAASIVRAAEDDLFRFGSLD